jgi:RHS repeat-associated protein
MALSYGIRKYSGWLAFSLTLVCLLGAAFLFRGVDSVEACSGTNVAPTPPPTPRPTPPPCEKCPDLCQKSPCYVGSGSYATGATDLSVPTIGFPLTASRRYDSTRAIDGAMGYGWTSSLTPRLYYATYLYSAPSTYQKEAEIIMPSGWSYVYVESGGGTFSPPPGRKDSLVRNGDGTFDLTLERSLSVYHFGSDGKALSLKDDYGNTLTFTYDANGRVQQVSDVAGSGRYFNVFWGANGRISSVQDNAGRQVQYTYDTQGALQTVTDAANRVTTYSYNNGRFSPLLARITDPWGRVITDITYDSSDRVLTYTKAAETYTYTYAYGGSAFTTAKADSQGNQFLYPFNGLGLVSDTIPPAGGPGPTHTDFFPDGSVMQSIDPMGVKTAYTYTANGSTQMVYRDYSGTNEVDVAYVYDPAYPHRPISITPKHLNGTANTDWQAWQYDYYQLGSPAPSALYHVYRIQSDGTTRDVLATYTYNSQGRVTRGTTATGGQTDYAYDPQGNLWTVTAPANNDAGTRPVTTYGYDALGRVTSVTDALGHQITYGYDALDRVTSVTLPKPSTSSPLIFTTTYSYDNYDSVSGLVFINVTDPNVVLTKQGYDQFGQLVKSIDGLNNSTSYTYSRGLLTTITDSNGNVTSYGYDAGRRLSRTTFPDGAYETYAYTADSLLSLKTDRKSQQVGYVYDAFKRISLKYYPSTTNIQYTYVGQKLTQVLDTMVTPNETHSFAYDVSYRVSSNTQPNRGTISYTYYADDTVATYSLSSLSTNYAYYPDGSLNTLIWSPVAGQFKYAYSLVGQYQSIAFPNGQSRNYSYDDQGRLLQLANLAAGGANLATYAYSYDYNYTTATYTRLGQTASMTASVPSQGLSNHLTTYEYDQLYQLTKATYPSVAPFNGEVDSWTYDAIGNRLTNTVNGSTQTYSYQKIGANPNNWQRLLSDGSTTYTYDANGNAATVNGPAGSFTLGFDKLDRLASITGSTTASYVYDYQGRRSSKTTGGTTYPYMYDGLNELSEGYAPTAGSFLFGPWIDEPLAMLKNGSIYYYGADALGSVNILTDSNGSIQNKYLTDAWGSSRSQTEAIASPFVFTGREKGEASNLFYRARFYAPTAGRFLSEEPNGATYRVAGRVVATRGLENFYAYVGGDPQSWVDPEGLARARPTPKPTPPPPTPTPLPGPPITRRPPNTAEGIFNPCGAGTHPIFWDQMSLNPFTNPSSWSAFQSAFVAVCDKPGETPWCHYMVASNSSGPAGWCVCCQCDPTPTPTSTPTPGR